MSKIEEKEADGPPFGLQNIPSRNLVDFVLKTRDSAQKASYLVEYTPQPIEIKDEQNEKIIFALCLAENLLKKPTAIPPKTQENQSKSENVAKNSPFLPPFAKGSHVCSISLSENIKYELILNKFPVWPNHLLCVSNPYVNQTDLLSKQELSMLLGLLESFDSDDHESIIFMNSGAESGATQLHRHVHCLFIKKPVSKKLLKLSNDDQYVNELFNEKNKLFHFLKVDFDLQSKQTKLNLPQLLHDEYIKILDKWNTVDLLAPKGVSYNLVLLRNTMIIIPRKESHWVFHDKNENDPVRIAINALPFVGVVFADTKLGFECVKKIERMRDKTVYPVLFLRLVVLIKNIIFLLSCTKKIFKIKSGPK
ncbi:Diadenosine 5',5''-P1,P4-tetraphosphate phosphorylase II (AP4A phosphorylase) [Reticulomyxa filosa]|uniref:Diadenosine 5',5''-P1,P4-tetraphosphate phosphorylase II (AP4A phosphorylase) n=1 Tax=Reticulomyxa filosa TaxID=46433 RepID=X6MFK2_RETFI|nr:Diadenosine 5',5''-P1,P4-tetraphosphate phosphorylase II (AP4A phosphorylase) [Reticulomyxa filosa]|eukprot:ETO12202.1 Diadenosine 5',5''-P1,P4-tetraphosphate phosphorylase II (AP4A phosphorylase) [Reticulomyxa filosa]